MKTKKRKSVTVWLFAEEWHNVNGDLCVSWKAFGTRRIAQMAKRSVALAASHAAAYHTGPIVRVEVPR